LRSDRNWRCFEIIISHKNISRQGNKANEDFAFSCEQYIFVVDGASGLSDKNYTHYESDAQWFAHRLGTLLQIRLQRMDEKIEDILSEIIDELRAEYETFLPNADPNPFAMPSASLSILRLNRGCIELFQLGDCVTVLTTKDCDVEVFWDDSVVNLDNAVIETIVNISHEKKISYPDALMYKRDYLIHNRKKCNVPDGYWILDLSGIGIRHAYTNSFPACNVTAAAILSDGFAEIVRLYELYDYKRLMEQIEKYSLHLLCDELFKAQDQDVSMAKHPRLKHRDDSSAAWCSIQRKNKHTAQRSSYRSWGAGVSPATPFCVAKSSMLRLPANGSNTFRSIILCIVFGISIRSRAECR